MFRSRFEPDDDEYQSFKILIFCGVGLLISLWFAWTEVKYLIFAETATASVVEAEIVESAGRRGRRIEKLFVRYQFEETDGTLRSEEDQASPSYPLPDDGTVEVQYFAGEGNDSRLMGNSHQWSLFVVLGFLLFAGFMLWKLIREANSPYPTSRGSRTPRRKAI